MLKKLLLRVIKANNALEGREAVVLGVKKDMYWSWFEKITAALCGCL